MSTERPNPEGVVPNYSWYTLKDPHFWAEAWSRAQENSLQARWQRNLDTMEYWNRQAGRFERWTGEERTRRRVARVLAWLEQEGALQPKMEVLRKELFWNSWKPSAFIKSIWTVTPPS